jgi:serine/threonine-protein kinase RsbW
MTANLSTRIAATCPHDAFLGRGDELAAVLRSDAPAVFVGSAPGGGSSELVRQAYDKIFHAGGNTAPVYFPLRRKSEPLTDAARRFLYQFIVQLTAFRGRDAGLIKMRPTLAEIAEISTDKDLAWLEPLLTLYVSKVPETAEQIFIETCFGAPFRAEAAGIETVVIIDDIHYAPETANHVAAILRDIDVRVVLAGRRRFDPHLKDANTILLEPFAEASGVEFVHSLAKRTGVAVTDSTADLLIGQFSGNAQNIEMLFAAARAADTSLETYSEVGVTYANDVLRGRLFRKYSALIEDSLGGNAARSGAIKYLHELYFGPEAPPKTAVAKLVFKQKVSVPDADLAQKLVQNELANRGPKGLEPVADDTVLRDAVNVLYRLEIACEREQTVAADLISHQLKRAPRLMSAVYRKRKSIGIKELMAAFDGREIPAALIDYGIFRRDHLGMTDAEINEQLASDKRTMRLQTVVHTAFTEDIYPQISKLTSKERSAVAIGFRGNSFDDETEVIWIAAEIDSKLEASADLTEFWCDRLEMAALMGNFVNYRLWLISPGGFSPEALDVLETRGSFGSSRKQAELLKAFLTGTRIVPQPIGMTEYEITVPMSDESEIIAANALEDIAKRHGLGSKTINQLKTALIEACINAAEHGASPDGKIRQKIAVGEGRIEMIVSNRGVRLGDRQNGSDEKQARRGWGLKLMQTLMDEVTIEDVEDGTCIKMVKYE